MFFLGFLIFFIQLMQPICVANLIWSKLIYPNFPKITTSAAV